MNLQLKQSLEEFKVITIKLIEMIEKGDFEALEDLLLNRQQKIDEMDKMTYTKEEFTMLCSEVQILRLQEKLTNLMNEKRFEVRNEINKLTDMKSANKSYNKRFNVDSIYFNKKI